MFISFFYYTQSFWNALLFMLLRLPSAVLIAFGLRYLFPEQLLLIYIPAALALTWIAGLNIRFVILKGTEEIPKDWVD